MKRLIRFTYVIEVLGALFLERGAPVHLRPGNSPEFIANDF
jgi:hypothetical protein